MIDNTIQVSSKEIKSDGRFHLYVRPDKYAKEGDKGIIQIICNPVSGEALPPATIEWEIVKPPEKEPKLRVQRPNIRPVKYADATSEDSDLLKNWEAMIDSPYFKEVLPENLSRQVSYEIKHLATADGSSEIVIIINKNFPKFREGIYRYKKRKDQFKLLVEAELKIIASIEAMNSYYPKADTDDAVDECIELADKVKYRYCNSNFINVCWRVMQIMDEKK